MLLSFNLCINVVNIPFAWIMSNMTFNLLLVFTFCVIKKHSLLLYKSVDYSLCQSGYA